MNDVISRQAALEVIRAMQTYRLSEGDDLLLVDQAGAQTELMMLPPAVPELLTSKEQRIFLAAMGREEEVCRDVDKKYSEDPSGHNLVWVCREIRRKVKGALWAK